LFEQTAQTCHRQPSDWHLDAQQDGGLISYGPDTVEMTRRSATFVDKISKGADPANLPIEQPRRFELAVNTKSAKALGLNLPPIFFARADDDRVILPHCGKRQAGAFLLSWAG
jgi:hypothetical protein